jgi:hypothetical protein
MEWQAYAESATQSLPSPAIILVTVRRVAILNLPREAGQIYADPVISRPDLVRIAADVRIARMLLVRNAEQSARHFWSIVRKPETQTSDF